MSILFIRLLTIKLLIRFESLIYRILPKKLTRKFYKKISYKTSSNSFINIQDGLFFRSLDFGGSATQSKVCKILTSEPILETLKILYFAGVLYRHDDEYKTSKSSDTDILILGLGGGDLLRGYYSLFANIHNKTTITAVEKSAEIIAIANKYFYLNEFISNPHINVNILRDDAFRYISAYQTYSNEQNFNLIVVDFFTELNSAVQLLSKNYVEHLSMRLKSDGLLAFNILVSEQTSINNFLHLLKEFFNTNLLLITSPHHYNNVIFCFNSEEYIYHLQDLDDYYNYMSGFITIPKINGELGYCAQYKL